MLKLNPATADRVLAVVSVALSIAACAALAIAFFLPLVEFLFYRDHSESTVFVMLGGVLLVSSPLLAIAAVVSAHISRRYFPHVGLGRVGLILGYSLLGMLAVFAVLAIATWFTIRSR